MKLFPKLLLAALVIAVLLPFTLLKKDDGSTMMSFSDFELPDFSSPSLPDLPQVDDITESAGIGDRQVTIYEWQDSDGNLQFANETPPPGTEFRIRQFDPDANVIQSVTWPAETPDAPAGDATQPETSAADQAPNAFSPESVKKLMDNAKNIENLLNQRFQNQQSAIDQ